MVAATRLTIMISTALLVAGVRAFAAHALPMHVMSAYGHADGPLRTVHAPRDPDQRPASAHPQDYNIGVIQVRLSNRTSTTTAPTTTSSTTAATAGRRAGLPRPSALSAAPPPPPPPSPDAPTTRRVRTRPRQSRRRPPDLYEDVDYAAAAAEPTGKPRMAPIDNTFLYMLAAVLLGLVLLTTTIYSIMWCLSCRRRAADEDIPMQFPARYHYYNRGPWANEHRGSSEMERLFRSDLEYKRPPLVAPPPPPPRVPPPPVPQHFRPHPSYERRRPLHQPHRDSPVEREIRLQMLKRQISESTLSTRTRTNSF